MPSVRSPGVRNLRACRWAPFVHPVVFRGVDWTDATATLEVRDYKDKPGAALIALANASGTAEGIGITVEVIDGVSYSTVEIRMDEATLEALYPPLSAGILPGADVPLVYALHITPAGGIKQRWMEGSFTILAGANQA